MKNVERFQAILNFECPDDRLPVMEWASWWVDTIKAWVAQGLDKKLSGKALFDYFGLDMHHQLWLPHKSQDCPSPPSYGQGIVYNDDDYDKIRPYLYPKDAAANTAEFLRQIKDEHEAGDSVVWFTLDGSFWFPRSLFGIENHFYSFFDTPELYHRILDDLAEYQLTLLDAIYSVLTPEFMTIAEDMSYNHGPMLSESLFEEFCAPYYRKIVPHIRDCGTKVFVDTDGDVTAMIPWLRRAHVQGVLPLERQAGVDINALRKEYPDFLMLGGYDKMVMSRGEASMRGEFERLLPVMRSGGYILGVDHQTPPGVTLAEYKSFLELFNEYARTAVKRI